MPPSSPPLMRGKSPTRLSGGAFSLFRCLAEFVPADTKYIVFVFPGDMCVRKNTFQPARKAVFRFLAFKSVLAEPGEEILRLLALRIAEDVGGSALLTDDALVHVHHMGGDVPGEGHLVGHHQHGHALVG